MYRSIVVPLDGSSFGEHALPHALTLARRSGAVVHLAHVHIASDAIYSLGGMPIMDDTLEVPRRESERAYLEALAQRLASTWDVAVTHTLLDGEPTVALCAYIVSAGADLIVMSTHGRGPVSRFWLGSMADTLARHASAPLMLVRPCHQANEQCNLSREISLRRVLIPLDGSKLAEEALLHALSLGGPTDAEYTLFQAINPIVMEYAPIARSIDIDDPQAREWRFEAMSYLDQVACRIRAQHVRVQTAVALAPPAVAILDYAHEHSVDLIAMATHGRTGLARVLLGSVADKVVRGASAPVLLHRPSA